MDSENRGGRQLDHLEKYYQDLPKAWEQVGRFMFYFARMETKITAIVGVIFGVKEERLIELLGQSMDISRKISIIDNYIPAADRSAEWKKRAKSVIGAAKGINNPTRTLVAHSEFIGYPHGVEFKRFTGGVTKLQRREIWSPEEFDEACDRVRRITDQLDFIRLALEPVERKTFAGMPYSHESHLEPADRALLDLDHEPSE